MLTLEGVSYRYPGDTHDTLHAVHLELPAGTVTGLTGPSDAGKSTLCAVAGGLAPRLLGGRLTGDIRLEGEAIAPWPMHRIAEHIVTGLQDAAGQLSLIAETVFEEVAFGPANLGLPRDALVERTERVLDRVGIADLAGRDPTRLSGGQQQLVVIAGLLAMCPRVLVLDEPIAHLDAASGRLVLEAVRSIADDGTAVLLAEQRLEALEQCDRLAVIAHGNLVTEGPPRAVLSDPAVTVLGIAEPPEVRLRRRLGEAGLDARLLEATP